MNAAMLSDSGVAQVNIGRVGDITLDQAAAVVIGWRGSKPAASDVIKWLGRDAVELRFDYSKSSLYERLFLRDGYVYAYSIAPFIGYRTGGSFTETTPSNGARSRSSMGTFRRGASRLRRATFADRPGASRTAGGRARPSS